METNKYCKALFAAISSVLLVITALTITPIRADAQVFDKPVVYGVDDIITDDEYPAAVHNFMFKYHNAIISSKYKLKRLSRITESYAEACTREPSWKLYCSAYYGRCLMAGYNPDHLKARGAKILEDALSDPSESQLTVPDRLTFITDLANAYLYGDGVENNDAKAFDLYRQAQNISPIFNGIIATCYLVGIGTPVDVDKACYYYALNYDDPELESYDARKETMKGYMQYPTTGQTMYQQIFRQVIMKPYVQFSSMIMTRLKNCWTRTAFSVILHQCMRWPVCMRRLVMTNLQQNFTVRRCPPDTCRGNLFTT